MDAIGVHSQPTFSRLIARAGPRVVAVGRARARCYAAARQIRDLPVELPLFRVDAGGTIGPVATLRPYEPGGVFVDAPPVSPGWRAGARGDFTFDGLPVEISDLLPAGFLGRLFARNHAELAIPDRPDRWSTDDGWVALARAGDDGPGDRVLGEESARRLYARWAENPDVIAASARSGAYPKLAAEAIAGVAPGPLVGGDQPKFGAIVGDGASADHVLVKFSPSEYSPSARRWCDLLVCEHLALERLRSRDFPAVASDIVEGGSRVFLQTARFDRIGSRGRAPVVSLAALNAEYVGAAPMSAPWSTVAERLAAGRWLAPAAVAQVRVLEAFGRFIANTDMHPGNLSFLPRDDGALDLAPAYDMLPMGYAPVAGDVTSTAFVVPAPDPGHETVWSTAGELAIDYWDSVARDERVSTAFRAIASANASAVTRALERYPRR